MSLMIIWHFSARSDWYQEVTPDTTRIGRNGESADRQRWI